MNKIDKTIYVIFLIFALLILSGFYFVFDKIANLKTDLRNLELSLELKEKNNSPPQDVTEPKDINPTSTNPESNNNEIVIPTAIVFETQSDPILQPQTRITINVENVTKTNNGTVKVNIKILPNETDTYSSLDIKSFFQLVNLNDSNQLTEKIDGNFNAIPPKTSMKGALNFKINSAQNKIILQIGKDTAIKFYEFDFDKKTYSEILIG